MGWLLSWHCTSVSNAKHNIYDYYCIKSCITLMNVVFAILYRKLYWLVHGYMSRNG
jgi:hypothetical protein